MFREICEFIELHTTFIRGSTLQVGHEIQGAPDDCIIVQEVSPSGTDPYLKDRVDKMIQVISRAKTFLTAEAQAVEVFSFLHDAVAWNLPVIGGSAPALHAAIIQAISDPYYLGEDEKRRFLFTVNFQFKIQSL